jgi:putative transposase
MGAQRFVHNRKCEELRYQLWLRRYALLSPSWNGDGGYLPMDQAFSHYRQANPWMAGIPSQVFRNGAFRFNQSLCRWYRKTGGRPTLHSRDGTQSVLLTSELFIIDRHGLYVGSRKTPVGRIRWVAHRQYEIPRQISITRQADGQWFVGFSFEDEVPEPPLARVEREEQILGSDPGVARTSTDSEGNVDHYSPKELARAEKRERTMGRLQRRLQRQIRGSQRRRKTQLRIARIQARNAQMRRNRSHQISRALVDRAPKALAMEDTALSNMTRRPKPRPEEDHWLPNGATAKAGLNKAILGRCLGMIRTQAEYKCRWTGKAFILVPAAYSSTRCRCCGHTDPGNRPTQAEFYCQACGHREHADVHAARDHRHRAWLMLRPPGTEGRKSPEEDAPHPLIREASATSTVA